MEDTVLLESTDRNIVKVQIFYLVQYGIMAKLEDATGLSPVGHNVREGSNPSGSTLCGHISIGRESLSYGEGYRFKFCCPYNITQFLAQSGRATAIKKLTCKKVTNSKEQ